jgi:hypothetical protein
MNEPKDYGKRVKLYMGLVELKYYENGSKVGLHNAQCVAL